MLNINHKPQQIWGNGGNDTFHFENHGSDNFSPRGGNDRNVDRLKINDFNNGDKIDLSDLGVDLSDVSIVYRGHSVQLTVSVEDGHDQIIQLVGARDAFDTGDLIFSV